LTTGSSSIGIGTYAGVKETGSSKLFIDSIYRSTEALGRSLSIIYGVMADATASQHLYLNANTYIAQMAKIGGTAVRGTTEGTCHLDIFDGTAPVGTLANGCSFYSEGGVPKIMNAAGEVVSLTTSGGLVGSYIARPSYKKMWALIPHHKTFHGIGTIASVAGTMVLEYVTGVSWSKFTTGSTAGNSVSAWTALSTTPEANPDINFVFKTNSSLADTRIWCGYCSAIPTSGGGDDPKGNSNAMIRFSQGVDTNWQLYTSDGVNSHVTDTGVVVAVSTTYTVRLWTTDYGTTWNCAVNGTTVNTTSNVPTLIGANTISLFTKANAGKSIWCQYGEGTHG
jgi:hypothetical protein